MLHASIWGNSEPDGEAGFDPQESTSQSHRESNHDDEHLRRAIGGEEEEDEGDFHPIVDSYWFNIAVNAMTLINTLQMGLEADHPDWTTAWTISENVFTAGFFVEMITKLFVLRFKYFHDKANWLDGGLTMLGVLDCWILSLFGGAADLQSLSVLRILRLMRLARMVKLVRSFKPFVLVIQGVFQAIATTVNVFVLLVFIFYVFAIFLTEHVGRCDPDLYPGYSKEEEVIDEQEIMMNYNPYLAFGSMGISMLTLFNMAIMAEWAEIVRPIAYKQGPVFVAVFIVFAMVVAFGVMNVMIGMIVDSVVAESRRLEEDFGKKEKECKLQNLKKVQKLLEQMDSNHDNAIDINELSAAMETNAELRQLLKSIKLPSGWRPCELLDMLDNSGDGELQKGEFTTSFFRLLDSDETQQICIMQASINQVKHLVRKVNETILDKFAVMEKEICSVKSAVCPPDGHAHMATDSGVSEKAASEPCSEPVCKEPAKAVHITNDALTGFTDSVCKELKQTMEHISHKQVADTIENVSYKQLTETLDAAYTVMKESFQKELASMTPALEGQLRVARPPHLSSLESCSTMSGATETKASSLADRVAAERPSASSEALGAPVKGVPLLQTPLLQTPLLETPSFLLKAATSLLSGQPHNAAVNSGNHNSDLRPTVLDGADSDGCARHADDHDFESLASASQAGDTAITCQPETNSHLAPLASMDTMAAATQQHSASGEHACARLAPLPARDSSTAVCAGMTADSGDQSKHVAANVPRAVYEFKFEDGTPQLGFSVHWEPNEIPLVGGVLPGGASDLHGVLRGDRLAEVNGISTISKSREEVLQLLKARPLRLRMFRGDAG